MFRRGQAESLSLPSPLPPLASYSMYKHYTMSIHHLADDDENKLNPTVQLLWFSRSWPSSLLLYPPNIQILLVHHRRAAAPPNDHQGPTTVDLSSIEQIGRGNWTTALFLLRAFKRFQIYPMPAFPFHKSTILTFYCLYLFPYSTTE